MTPQRNYDVNEQPLAFQQNPVADTSARAALQARFALRGNLFALCLLFFSLGTPAPARADLTAFVGRNTTLSSQVTGFAAGLSLLMFGVEFEYSGTAQTYPAAPNALHTGTVNLLAQAPFVISRLQFYGTIGGGLSRKKAGNLTETYRASNAGGGVKIVVSGPIRLRVDYRIITFRRTRNHRFYTGLNLAF